MHRASCRSLDQYACLIRRHRYSFLTLLLNCNTNRHVGGDLDAGLTGSRLLFREHVQQASDCATWEIVLRYLQFDHALREVSSPTSGLFIGLRCPHTHDVIGDDDVYHTKSSIGSGGLCSV